ncbi:MAG: HAD hydrolase-like protein [Anaerostipes sp.]|uniref:HAD hydrolase-like protein n=1 Tax=Anaerostipes sp. TaxID=1872530 RepID=UPI0039A33499
MRLQRKISRILWKPSKHTLDYIIQETGYEPDEIAIVGDRLYTDIAVADQVM